MIARRGQGFKEKLLKCYENKEIFKPEEKKTKKKSKNSACVVDKAGVPQKIKLTGATSLLNAKFSKVCKVCRIAVLTAQFTGQKKFRNKLPNWSILKKYVLLGKDSKLKMLVPSLS